MSKNKQTHLEKISKGIAIYKVGASPFWYVRLWNVATKAYTVRTTKCSIKAEAIEEAYAIKNKLKGTQSLTAAPKHFSFEHFARQQMQIQQRLVNAGQRNPRFVTDDIAILERSEDGILSYLGHRDIRKISARDIREYLQLLDQRRQAPLSADTLKRHLVLIRKILHLAREDGVLVEIPSFPKISKKDAPRPSFTPSELKTLCQKIEEISRVSGLVVRGAQITLELRDLCLFLANTGLRPTIKEVYSLKHEDIQIVDNPDNPHLFLTVKQGKTGYRNSYSTPTAKTVYQKLLKRRGKVSSTDWLFFPGYSNRAHAASIASRQFKYVLKIIDMENDTLNQVRVLYSLRHFYIQQRLASQVSVYDLANNVGTSVSMIERFYGKYPLHSSSRAASLNSGIKSIQNNRKTKYLNEKETISAIIKCSEKKMTIKEISETLNISPMKVKLTLIQSK